MNQEQDIQKIDLKNIQDMESRLLGLAYTDKHVFDNDIAHRIEPHHFLIEINSVLFASLMKIYNSGYSGEFEFQDIYETMDLLYDELKIHNKPSKEEIINYMAELSLNKGLKGNVRRYIDFIKKRYNKTIYKQELEKIESELDKGLDVETANSKITALAMEIQDSENGKFGNKPSTFFSDNLKQILESDGEPIGYKTGWKSFDGILGGIERKTVTTVAARPSMGKTAFGVDLAYNLAKNDVPVCFFSAEMDAEDISKRFITSQSGIGTRYLLDYKYLNKDKNRIKLIEWATRKISELPLIVDDHAGLSIEDISWKMQKYAKDGYKVFIIDYIQFIKVRQKVGQGKDHEKISYMMRELKTLAKKHNVAIVNLAQIGRGLEKERQKRPQLSDIKGSGSIEENSDKVIALHRPWFYERGTSTSANLKRANKIQQMQVFVLKNRNGATKDINFHYWMDYNHFIEVELDANGKELKPEEKIPTIMPYNDYVEKIVPYIKKKAESEMKIDSEGKEFKQLGFVTQAEKLEEV